MTDTDAPRPLPTDRQALKAFMPAEPECGVTQTRVAIGRIDKVIAACREHIIQRDEHDHQLVTDLIAAASPATSWNRSPPAWSPATGPTLDHRLDNSSTARLLAEHKLTRPSTTIRSTSHGSRHAPRST